MRLPLVLAATVAAALCVTSPARAENRFDLSTVKCKDFVSSSKDDIAMILMWLAGYYSDEDAPPIVDFDKMKTDSKALGEYCGKHPDDSLITASEEVMNK